MGHPYDKMELASFLSCSKGGQLLIEFLFKCWAIETNISNENRLYGWMWSARWLLWNHQHGPRSEGFVPEEYFCKTVPNRPWPGILGYLIHPFIHDLSSSVLMLFVLPGRDGLCGQPTTTGRTFLWAIWPWKSWGSRVTVEESQVYCRNVQLNTRHEL